MKYPEERFLEELKWHEEAHQICFYTEGALQTLKNESI
jgi:hypothetical protein